eukprot:COSAG02_NODE_397_length_23124_cov_439.255635_15_plen_540_part_01
MPTSSVSRVQLNELMQSNNTPPSELVWVQGHLDGHAAIPAAETARAKRWMRGHARKAAVRQTAADIVDVAELLDNPTSYTLRTLGNGQEIWVPVGRDSQEYADEVAAKLGIAITPPPTAQKQDVAADADEPLLNEATSPARAPELAPSAGDHASTASIPLPPTTPSRIVSTGPREKRINQATATLLPSPEPNVDSDTAELLAAEEAAAAAVRTAAELVNRSKDLRLKQLRQPQRHARMGPDTVHRIYLRGVRSGLTRFLRADKAAAMARFPWYRQQVERSIRPRHRLADDGVWAVVPESSTSWECYLQSQPHFAGQDHHRQLYTLHSQFGTRYGTEAENTFESFDQFLDQFSGPSELDVWVERQNDDAAEEKVEVITPEDVGSANENEDAQDAVVDVEEMILWAAWRPEQQKAQVRRQERHDMQESTYVERTVDLDMADNRAEEYMEDAEEEEEHEKRLAAIAEAHRQKKLREGKLKEVVGMSKIILDVKPWDSDTDMEELERLVREIGQKERNAEADDQTSRDSTTSPRDPPPIEWQAS